VRQELARRHALARRPQPEGVATPPLRLLMAELGTGYECWRAWRQVDRAPVAQASRAQPVMLLPGFGTHPFRMRTLSRALTAAGHQVCDWGLGWNLGATPEKLDRLCDGLEAMAERHQAPVALVGWSLGGLFAREAAKRLPDHVSLVVTMGSPFSGDLHANHAWRAYHLITGQDVSTPPLPGDIAEKPPVPTVALWSPRDGIVAPRAARGRAGERDAAVALRCTHLGFASHPAVAATVLSLLDSDLAN
jgi:pimeloyl-ACP methyl ester carboxylesterase